MPRFNYTDRNIVFSAVTRLLPLVGTEGTQNLDSIKRILTKLSDSKTLSDIIPEYGAAQILESREKTIYDVFIYDTNDEQNQDDNFELLDLEDYKTRFIFNTSKSFTSQVNEISQEILFSQFIVSFENNGVPEIIQICPDTLADLADLLNIDLFDMENKMDITPDNTLIEITEIPTINIGLDEEPTQPDEEDFDYPEEKPYKEVVLEGEDEDDEDEEEEDDEDEEIYFDNYDASDDEEDEDIINFRFGNKKDASYNLRRRRANLIAILNSPKNNGDYTKNLFDSVVYMCKSKGGCTRFINSKNISCASILEVDGYFLVIANKVQIGVQLNHSAKGSIVEYNGRAFKSNLEFSEFLDFITGENFSEYEAQLISKFKVKAKPKTKQPIKLSKERNTPQVPTTEDFLLTPPKGLIEARKLEVELESKIWYIISGSMSDKEMNLLTEVLKKNELLVHTLYAYNSIFDIGDFEGFLNFRLSKNLEWGKLLLNETPFEEIEIGIMDGIKSVLKMSNPVLEERFSKGGVRALLTLKSSSREFKNMEEKDIKVSMGLIKKIKSNYSYLKKELGLS